MANTSPTPATPAAAAPSRPARLAPRPEVPLAVWPVAQVSAQYQRAGRYLRECTAYPGKMLPALAARIITEYSTPAQLVVDPTCGIGTTLVEAAALDRRAIGVELELRWAQLAMANLEHVLTPEQCLTVDVRGADAQHLPWVLRDAIGTVDLIVISPPYACDAGSVDKPAWVAGGRLCPPDLLNDSTDRANVGHARGENYATATAGIYPAATSCYARAG
jgi:modification methylase